MKIAFDLRRIGNPGIGRYMRCLVEAILRQDAGNEYLLLLPADAPNIIRSNSSSVTRVTPHSGYYSVREQIELPKILRKHKIDLLHSPHFLLPLSRPCPVVVTIHDVIYLACREDLQSYLGRLYYSAMMRASARLANRIITDSCFSKNEIVGYLHADPKKIEVIYPAVDPTFRQISDAGTLNAVLAKYRIDRDYIFYTGIFKGRKNHAGLLRAFKRFLELGGNAQLVIAGPTDGGERHLRVLAEELQVLNQVIFTGFVDDLELAALYSGARVYACPSLYEGFGFTVLEAMACGAPVVCSKTSSLPEVAGEAACYADANDSKAFGEALHRVFTDEALRQEMTLRGRQNIRRFSWDKAANGCLQIYEEAAGMATVDVAPLTENRTTT